MKSICIKVNIKSKLDYLIEKTDLKHFDNIKCKTRKFKIYYNFIIHYFGDNEKDFLYNYSVLISDFIIEKYEHKIIKRCINKNYFYFEEFEKNVILKIAIKLLELQELEFNYREDILTDIIYNFLSRSKKLYLEGFINFRLNEYVNVLDNLVELSVMNYLKFV